MDETNMGPVPDGSGSTAYSSQHGKGDATHFPAPTPIQDGPWMNTSLSPDERAALLLAQMTLAEKVAVVHGEYGPYGFYNTPLPRLGFLP